MVVVAKYQTSNEKRQRYLGVGSTLQSFHNDGKIKYQVHLRAGFDRKIFKYVHNQTDLKLTSGAYISGMYNLSGDPRSYPDFSGTINVRNKLDLNVSSSDPYGLNVESSLEVEQSVGSSNWGDLTGKISSFEFRDIFGILKNLNLHLNQVNADIKVDKKLTDKEKLILQGEYKGSNIGQSIKFRAGLEVTAPSGAELLYFVGYAKNNINGYETKNSFLVAPSGEVVGIKYTSKNDSKFEVTGTGLTETPYVNGTIKFPLVKKKKK